MTFFCQNEMKNENKFVFLFEIFRRIIITLEIVLIFENDEENRNLYVL